MIWKEILVVMFYNIGIMVNHIYFWLVKWLVLKPMIKIGYIINGKLIGRKKWYQRSWDGKVRNNWIHITSYKLTKHVLFDKKTLNDF